MTIERTTEFSRDTIADWTPTARRHGERPQSSERARTAQETGEELVFPPISPPPIWPRVFPGI